MKRIPLKLIPRVEENKYYIVEKRENGKFLLHKKRGGTIIYCDEYLLINSTVLFRENGTALFHNEDHWQKYGQGHSLAYRFEIDSWKVKGDEVVIKYYDEKGYKFIRYVDKDGNLYKKTKKVVASEDQKVKPTI